MTMKTTLLLIILNHINYGLTAQVRVNKFDDYNDFGLLNGSFKIKNVQNGVSLDIYCKFLKTVSVLIVRFGNFLNDFPINLSSISRSTMKH
jgi:hypothetical protein